MSTLYKLLAALCAVCYFASCSEEEAPLPSYRQDLVEILTDGQGVVRKLLRDDGTSLAILNPGGGLTPDSAYRAYALYTEQPGGAEVQSFAGVHSPLPAVKEAAEAKFDPVGVTACWIGGRYVNLLLRLATGGGTQHVCFLDRGIAETHDGKRKLCLEVCHSQNRDPQYYSHETYVCCPIWPYADRLHAEADSVELKVATFDGAKVYRFLYPSFPNIP